MLTIFWPEITILWLDKPFSNQGFRIVLNHRNNNSLTISYNNGTLVNKFVKSQKYMQQW